MKELKPTHVDLTTQMEELLEQWLSGEPPAKREMGPPASSDIKQQAVEVIKHAAVEATTGVKRPLSLKDRLKELKKAKDH